jgi:bifunctional DNA-binding transcriptional regulator/antitoxin component of YhaV-PrlF toxin-antitoxin module
VVDHHAPSVVEPDVSIPPDNRLARPGVGAAVAAVSAASRPSRTHIDREQLIGALVPAPIRRPPPSPPPLPTLPALHVPTNARSDAVLLDIARLDRSGRIHARPLLDALGWRTGDRVDIAVIAGVLVIGSTPTGLQVVGDRGVLTLPAAARSMCHIEPGEPVVLLVSLRQKALVVHPASTVTGLLAQHHARLEGHRDDR